MKKVEKEVKSTPFQEKFAQYAMEDMKAIERKVGIGSSIDIPYMLSSGSLMLDIVYGGGLSSGWYTALGGEQSCKSTSAVEVLREAIKDNIPVYYFDAEGSVDGDYTPRIVRVKHLNQIFGEQDAKGNYVIPPKAKYYDDTAMEKVFGTIKERLLNLPDKRYKPEKNQWYLVFDPKRKTHLKMISSLGLKQSDKSRNQIWAPIGEEAKFQAIFIVDSYPAILPEVIDEDEDKDSQGIALQAREYAKWVPQIKGKLRRKHCLLYGVNQLREKPMVMYGKPTSEPCGTALKFFSDVRNEFSSISVSTVKMGSWDKGSTSAVCEENSVEFEGAIDQYAFKKVVNTKNKKGVPFLTAYVRVWFSDGSGKGRGFDPVFDTWSYLYLTNQIEGERRKTFKVKVKGFEDIVFTWELFKSYIIAEVYKDKGLIDKVKELLTKKKSKKKIKPVKLNLRTKCFEQIKANEYKQLLLEGQEEEELDDEDDDEFEAEEF